MPPTVSHLLSRRGSWSAGGLRHGRRAFAARWSTKKSCGAGRRILRSAAVKQLL